MRYGYARVSTEDQSNEVQLERLRAAGCERLYQDHGVSGVAPKRRQLERCLAQLEAGDALVVCSLDRLGRSLAQLIATMDSLRARAVSFESLSEKIDTATPHGMLVFHLVGALAQFERSLIAERTSAGRAAARAKGVRFGRPPRLTADQVAHAIALARDGASAPEIARVLGCGRSTAYRVLREQGTYS